MRTFRYVLGVSTAAVVLAACGSSGPSSSALSLSAARTKYSAAFAPVTVALNAFAHKSIAWTASTTDTQAAADAHSAIAALQTFTTTLKHTKWPSVASSDVQSVIGTLGTMTSDLQGLSSLAVGQEATWLSTTFSQDSVNALTANAKVYSDLGITPSGL